MISKEIRSVEWDVDESIRRLAIWKSSKNFLLRRLMEIWRHCLEVIYLKLSDGQMFQNSDSYKAALAGEHQLNIGIFWCLKWAFEYASDEINA